MSRKGRINSSLKTKPEAQITKPAAQITKPVAQTTKPITHIQIGGFTMTVMPPSKKTKGTENYTVRIDGRTIKPYVCDDATMYQVATGLLLDGSSSSPTMTYSGPGKLVNVFVNGKKVETEIPFKTKCVMSAAGVVCDGTLVTNTRLKSPKDRLSVDHVYHSKIGGQCSENVF